MSQQKHERTKEQTAGRKDRQMAGVTHGRRIIKKTRKKERKKKLTE